LFFVPDLDCDPAVIAIARKYRMQQCAWIRIALPLGFLARELKSDHLRRQKHDAGVDLRELDVLSAASPLTMNERSY
jgi:hypothetical protein